MERLLQFNDILYGYTGYNNNKRIVSFQFGTNKISLSNSGFNSGESIVKFLEYKGQLYGLVSGTNTSRVIRLSKVNSGLEDTWEEVIGVSDLDEKVVDMAIYSTGIYIIGSNTIWLLYDDAVTVVTNLPNNFVAISVCVSSDVLFLYGLVNNYSDNYQSVYKYQDSDFEEIDSSQSAIDHVGNFDANGKSLIIPHGGKVYYTIIQGDYIQMVSYDVSEHLLKNEYQLLSKFQYITTCLYVYENIILVAYYDMLYDTSNVITFVPNTIQIESVLVSGDGDIAEPIKTVPSDPIFTDPGMNKNVIPACDVLPVVGALKGTYNYSFKYENRLEAYSDLVDLENIVSAKLKEIIDSINNSLGTVFFTDGLNRARLEAREVIGKSNKFIEIKHSTDYGDNLIKDVGDVEAYPNNFVRITVQWANSLWSETNPIVLGSIIGSGNQFDLDNPLINDPVTAKNVAMSLLKQLVDTEQLSVSLAFAHFLEHGDNLSFNVNSDFIYLDKNREYKLYKVEHNFAEKTTNIVVVERILTNISDEI